MTTFQIQILDTNNFTLPAYSTPGSSGLDLRARVNQKVKLSSYTTILVPTGISMYIENPRITAMILPRSGLGHKKGIVLGNTIGLIDSDYQGQLMISLWNRSKKDFYIYPNDRIAQIIFIPIIRPKFILVKKFTKTHRGKRGFGHSGVK